MPLKLNVGVSKKVGLPEYSSAGASCNVELELDSGLIRDEEAFRATIADAMAACRAAVDAELARYGQVQMQQQPQAPEAAPPQRQAPPPAASAPAPAPASNGYRKERSQWGGGPLPPPRPAANNPGPGPKAGGQPRSGKALMAMLKGYEEEHPEAEGLFKYVCSFGKAQNYPPYMRDWGWDQIKQAEGVMQQFLTGEPSYSR